MAHPTKVDDPPDDDPPAGALALGEGEFDGGLPRPLSNGSRRPEIEAELRQWISLGTADRRTALREVIGGRRAATAEVLIYLCRRAHEENDRQELNLAFEALSKLAAPLLLSQATGMATDERREQAQQVLLELFAAIQTGKADFAESNFAAFAKRRAISLYRMRRARFEGSNIRIEPTIEADPLDSVPARIPSAEARALLSRALDKLSPKHRAAFIQYHLLERTQEEIATQFGVTVRTVHSWLKKAGDTVGLTGAEDDC